MIIGQIILDRNAPFQFIPYFTLLHKKSGRTVKIDITEYLDYDESKFEVVKKKEQLTLI